MKAIWIDAVNGTVAEIAVPDREEGRLEAMQRAVGGHIEAAFDMPGTRCRMETLYVDDEGLLKRYSYGFAWAGALQPYTPAAGW